MTLEQLAEQTHLSKSTLGSYEADDFFSVPEDSPLKGFLQAVDETASEDSDPDKASLAFICKRLKLNFWHYIHGNHRTWQRVCL